LTSAEGSLTLPSRKRSLLAALCRAASSPRLWTYIGCAALALLASSLLGKDMNWDTLDYHFYAGFSALHDRFGMDYFPAGSQSYFNPYIYVPFYLLASSRLSAIVDASILAILHSGILWLTYELALQVAPAPDGRSRTAVAICSALFAFANPILLNLFGSSYADVTTAELVLGGWLLLVLAVRAPSAKWIVSAGLLLGAASALKLTNSVHALSAGVLLFFLPVRWPCRIRHMAAFGAALGVSFVLVCLPWSIRLEQHFANPLFPLLNGIFRSPQFPTAKMLDFRFIPDSFAGAVWRPFAIAKPLFMVDDEQQSPDIRYAFLLVAAILLLLYWGWRTLRNKSSGPASEPDPNIRAGHRALLALGVGFGVDWILWLTASGNGRYFIAMACIAGVLAIALLFRLFATPKARVYLLSALFVAQCAQLCMGTTYRSHIPWDGHPWFEVRLPANLPRTPALYLSYGVQTNAFIVPFLPPGSGFVNLAGDYPLAAGGANGAKVAALVHAYWPRVRVLARDNRAQDKRLPTISGMAAATDALLPFGLSPAANDCSTIVIPNQGRQELLFVHTRFTGKSRSSKSVPDRQVPESTTGYLMTCPVAADPVAHSEVSPGERMANLALDRLEDACPEIFQPARPTTQYFGNARQDVWERRYLNTNLTVWVTRGWVQFLDPIRGGPATYIGPEAAFEQRDVRVLCGRRNERYFAKLVHSTAPRGGS
jgi:hypothetical protein